MKNIHLLPTDKPSRLYLGNNGNFVFGMMQTSIQSRNDDFTNQNTYITNDEEIKEGDWVLNISNNKIFKQDNSKYDGYTLSFYKKIILTTDTDLIKDGVQAIDIEFLEWFVKNPSCEEVFIVDDYEQVNQYNPILRGSTNSVHKYKISIPKEEPGQETLEEAAKGYSERHKDVSENLGKYLVSAVFQDGAKWQEQQTIEEVFEWLTTNNYLTDLKETLIENFKKR